LSTLSSRGFSSLNPFSFSSLSLDAYRVARKTTQTKNNVMDARTEHASNKNIELFAEAIPGR